MKVGVVATIAFAFLIGFPLASMAGLAPDDDSDGVPNVLDNCVNVKNAGTLNCDTNSDGWGNLCDCDINNSGNPTCLPSDITAFKTAYNGGTNLMADQNCSGTIAPSDITAFKVRYNAASSTKLSGLSCAGTIPCLP